MKLKKRYAEAIRHGIKMARKTNYGSVDDNYYEVRSQLLWEQAVGSYSLSYLTLRAFNREHKNLVLKAKASMTEEEKTQAEINFESCYLRMYESISQKYQREMLEEVRAIKEELKKGNTIDIT